jgi:hypothetical protein
MPWLLFRVVKRVNSYLSFSDSRWKQISLNLTHLNLLWALCLVLLVTPFTAVSQTLASSVFYEKAHQAVSGGKSPGTVTLSANAEWIAGSTHETGTAQLQAKVDGSSKVQLDLGKSSRTEVQSKTGSERTCAWTDQAGTGHDMVGPNCMIAIPWFAPSLFTQPLTALPALIAATDDGDVSKDGLTGHQISYLLNLQGTDTASTTRIVSNSTVKVLYDPLTFLPTSLEYKIHPDNNDLQDIPVRVVFSNYQSVSGVMLPFEIQKYVNRTLQLTLNVTNASID